MPDYAAVLDHNSVFSALRFVVANSFASPRPPLIVTPEPNETLMVGPAVESSTLISLIGPINATVWPDAVETHEHGRRH